MAYPNPNSNQIRIRDSGTVRQLNIRRENLEELQKIVSSRHKTDEFKKQMIKKLAVFVATLEISYSEGGATRIERYYSKCIERVCSQGTSYLITAVYFILIIGSSHSIPANWKKKPVLHSNRRTVTY